MLDITNYLGHFGRKKRDHSDFRFLREKSSPPRRNTGVCILDRQLYYPPPPLQEVIFIGGEGGGGCKNKK